MKIDNYIRSILPNFDRSMIKDDLVRVRDGMANNTIPPYKTAAENFGKGVFKLPIIKDLEKEFSKSIKGHKDNYVVTVHKGLVTIAEKVDRMIDLIDKEYARDVTRDGMTYLRVTLLQWAEAAGFIEKYSRKLLNVTLSVMNADASGERLPNPKKDRGVRWLMANQHNFVKAFNAINVLDREDTKRLKDIPEAIVDPESVASFTKVNGIHKVDPYSWGFISATFSPIFHARMAYTKYQAKKYKQAQVDKEALELKLAMYKGLKAGNQDAKLQKTIEYTEDRLNELDFMIDKMEKEANG